MEGSLILSKDEQFKLMVIEDYRAGRRSRREVSLLLSVSERTVTRLAARVRRSGAPGIKHGNCGRRPAVSTSSEFKNIVMDLVRDRYFDFNIAHCRDMLESEFKIKVAYSTLHRWCKVEGIRRQKHHRRPSKARLQRERFSNEGLLIQFDGSKHAWNGKDDWVLIAGIDDATSEIPFSKFYSVENTWNCMAVLREIILRKGIPVAIYTDKAGWLAGGKRQHFTQFVRACEELGINVIAASSAQAKGRIERAWDTFQDRLIPELRLAGIREMPAANQYLEEKFLPEYWNKRNTVLPKNEVTRYRKLPEWMNLDEILCWKYERYVKADSTFHFNGKRWKITGGAIGNLRSQQVKVHLYEDGGFAAFFGHSKLSYTEVFAPRRKWLKSAV